MLQQAVESGRVQLAERVVGWIGKIDHYEIVHVLRLIEPHEGVGIGHMNFGIRQRVRVQLAQQRMSREQLGHLRIEIGQLNTLDIGVL